MTTPIENHSRPQRALEAETARQEREREDLARVLRLSKDEVTPEPEEVR